MRLAARCSTACTAFVTRSCTTALDAPLHTTITPLISGATTCCTRGCWLPLTGYVHGGCSPVGMKKQFPTVFHETAESLSRVAVSAGKIGYQVVCDPKDLMALLRAAAADIIVE